MIYITTRVQIPTFLFLCLNSSYDDCMLILHVDTRGIGIIICLFVSCVTVSS